MNETVIRRLTEFGARMFRINLSHTKIEDLRPAIAYVRRFTAVPICLDTEGAQIRTGEFLDGPIQFHENSVVKGHTRPVPGDSGNMNFYPLDIVKQFEIGDLISIDFNSVLVHVVGIEDESITMRVLNGGDVGQNRAVSVDRPITLPPLTAKDRAAVAIGVELGITHYALSFASRPDDVDELRRLAGPDTLIISKIESRVGLTHLTTIAERSDAILIDRGDLSREVPIEQIPRIQKGIIAEAKRVGKKVYVATNLLESMVKAPTPTRAEVNDVYNTLADGVDGLVLAAETAIGDYPIQCAAMIVKLVENSSSETDQNHHFPNDPFSLLIPPHGGRLVCREAGPDDLDGMENLPVVEARPTDLMDCEQISQGTYSPLSGFMDHETVESVLETNRLLDGTVWTLPLTLQVKADCVRRFGVGDRVALTDQAGNIHSLLDVSDIFTTHLEATAKKWFGTDSRAHPGVARLYEGGETFIAGDVTLVKAAPSPHASYALTPHQTRYIFAHKGWARVLGFHTRNVCHRVHEYIQVRGLEETGAEGLFISPLLGPKKPNDFLPEPIIKSYQLLMESGLYPRGRVVLGSFSTYSRYCGPREAVFTALCRKNMGCSDFVVGRDHTGVGDYYDADANRRLFDEIGDIGVAPVYFNAIGYNPDTRQYEDGNGSAKVLSISGTQIRESLCRGERLPDWALRDIVQDMLLSEITAGRPLFHE